MLDQQWIQESWFYIQFRFDDFEIVNVQAKTCRCLLLATNVLLWYFPLNFTSSSKEIDVYWYTVFVYFNQFITRLERITSISSPFPVPSLNFWVRLIGLYNPETTLHTVVEKRMFCCYSPRLLKFYLLIFYFIKQLVFLPITGVDAFLDFETKEFLNGKTLRAAVLHVGSCSLFMTLILIRLLNQFIFQVGI